MKHCPSSRLSLWLSLWLLFTMSVGSAAASGDEASEVLDRFHRAAAEADFATYRAQMTDDIVFLGTDATERWQGEAFFDFARPHFEAGRGWTYRVRSRRLQVGPQGNVAWFDELLDNARLGLCRGSGLLLRGEDGWKVTQYNLSMPVPNDMIGQVAEAIGNGGAEGFAPAGTAPVPERSEAVSEDAVSEDAVSESDGREETRSGPCPRRHKTNRRADC